MHTYIHLLTPIDTYTVLFSIYSLKNGPTQIRTGVPRTRISYAAPTPWIPSSYHIYRYNNNLHTNLCLSQYIDINIHIHIIIHINTNTNINTNINTNTNTNTNTMITPTFLLYNYCLSFIYSIVSLSFIYKKRLPWVSNPRPYG